MILKKDMTEIIVNERIKWFKSIKKLYYQEIDFSDRVVLKSIPSTCEDICFLIGHNNPVKEYLDNNEIVEHTLVLVSCNIKSDWKNYHFGDKEVFICVQEDNMACLYDGRKFGLKFDPTESELMLMNAPKSETLKESISKSFTMIGERSA